MSRRSAALLGVILVIAATSFTSFSSAQAPGARDVRLVGGRFKPLTYDQMSPEQRTMIEHLLAGERAATSGPFNVLLRSPQMGDIAQQLGAYIRFRSALPARVREMAILISARHWTAQYEWYAHKRLALAAGVSPDVVSAIAEGKRPASLQPDERAVYEFETELLQTHHVGDATFQAARDAVGERGVVDLMGLIGYYDLVSIILNVDGYPLPEGAAPELAPVSRDRGDIIVF